MGRLQNAWLQNKNSIESKYSGIKYPNWTNYVIFKANNTHKTRKFVVTFNVSSKSTELKPVKQEVS